MYVLYFSIFQYFPNFISNHAQNSVLKITDESVKLEAMHVPLTDLFLTCIYIYTYGDPLPNGQIS